MKIEPPLYDVLKLVQRKPKRPPSYMALLLDQPLDDLMYRLRAGTMLGWFIETRSPCCNHPRFEITALGLELLNNYYT